MTIRLIGTTGVCCLLPALLLHAAAAYGQVDPLGSDAKPPASKPPAAAAPRVEFVTNHGKFVIECNVEAAPRSSLNFLEYVADGFYDGTIIHRVSESGLIQGGEYLPSLDRKTANLRNPVLFEGQNGLSNTRGSIALVRGIAPNSATTGFFINVTDNAEELDVASGRRGYAVFGSVVEHMETIDRIAKVEVSSHPKYAAGRLAVVPTKPVVISSARILSQAESMNLARAKVDALDDTRPEKTPEDLLAELIKRKEKETGQKFEESQNGIKSIDVRVGVGPSPTLEDNVQISYRGWLVSGREFENSYALESPPVFLLNDLNDGLREAIAGMNVGGKRLALIPPELAYGAHGIPYGNPPRVPPNATLLYEIELLDIKGGSP